MRFRTVAVSLFLLLALAPVGFPPAAAQAQETFTEFFDDDTVGQDPSGDWYDYTTTGSGDTRVSSAFSQSSPNSLKLATGKTGYFDLSGIGGDLCGLGDGTGPHVVFDVYTETLSSTESYFVYSTRTSEPTVPRGFALLFDSDSAPNIDARSDTGSTSTQFNGILAADSWYTVDIRIADCATAQVSVCINPGDICSSSDATGTIADPINMLVFGGANTHLLYIDNLTVHDLYTTPPVPAITDFTTKHIGAGDITGYDIDETGSTLIIRNATAIPDSVSAYSAASLTQSGGDAASGCNRIDGVGASRSANVGSYVYYLSCESGMENEVEFLKVRDTDLTDFSGFDSDCDDCQQDIPLGTLAEDEDQVAQISEMVTYPLSHENGEQSVFDIEAVFGVFYSRIDGGIGFAAKQIRFSEGGSQVQDRQDVHDFAWAPSQADQICAFPRNGEVYLVAVQQSMTTTVWKATLSTTAVSLDTNLAQFWTAPGASNGRGVACSHDRVIVIHGTTATVLNAANGATICTKTGLTLAPRGVGASSGHADPNGDNGPARFTIGAVVDGSDVVIFDATTCEDLATFALPTITTTLRGIDLDRHAQNAWAVTDTQIRKAVIYTVTSIVPVGTGGGGQPDDAESSEPSGEGTDPPGGGDAGGFGGGLFGPVIAGASGPGQVFPTAEAAAAFAAMLLILFLGMALGLAPKYFDQTLSVKEAFSPTLFVLGVVIGFGLSWFAFSLITTAFAVSLIVLGILGIVVKVAVSRMGA